MDHNTISLIISLISGLIGGHLAGAGLGDKSLGTLGNSISGIVGGAGGSFILKMMGLLGTAAAASTGAAPAEGASSFDIASLLTNIGGSGAGGAILTAIIGVLKESMQKK